MTESKQELLRGTLDMLIPNENPEFRRKCARRQLFENARTYFYQGNGSETGTISHTITLRVVRLFCAIQNRAAAIGKKALNSTSHLECQTLFGNFFDFAPQNEHHAFGAANQGARTARYATERVIIAAHVEKSARGAEVI